MSAIRTMCPHCITSVDLDPAEILLVGTPQGEDTGSYAYACHTCQRVTVASLSAASFAVLVTAGVRVQTTRPPAPPFPAGRRLTLNDLIDLHELLRTDDWFTQLIRTR
jgi:hypothetical protein